MHRFVCDLLRGELARLRPGRAPLPLPWPDDLRLADDAGIDSLERLQLATALGEAIHLHRSGIGGGLVDAPTIGAWTTLAAASLAVFSAELTFRTSGSTGQPKWCLHEHADLAAEIDVLAESFAGCRRVIATVPSHHIYGFLFTILLPDRFGIETVDVRADAPSALAELVRPGDLVIGHPEFWRAFVRTVPRVVPGVVGVTSTAPCSAETADGVVAAGITPLVEVYGSSETAGIGLRDDPRAAFALFPFWRRGDGDSELVRTRSGRGELRVTVPDRLIWEDARHVRPAGRAEGAVQVAGVNVFPQRVRGVLCAHPGVADATVRLMQPAEGERLKAFVVPHRPTSDPARLLAELWVWIDERLTAPERPKSIVIGPHLPTGPLGKSADWPVE